MGEFEELRARVRDAVAGTQYRMALTASGFDLTIDVQEPGRTSTVWTYRVELAAAERVFTITDVVLTTEYWPGGRRKSVHKSVGRSVYRTRHRAVGGTEWYTFSSADGHRLIRGVAEELGWREERPASMRKALRAAYSVAAMTAAVLIGLLVALIAGKF
ncbi:hypothetical protein [Streptomyces sp. NBC_01304]|uniref:hypothetical protein n=1 Tax=Streptomyces sp. NBC_01304 TaxID=2903818 RepID=UPI002E0FE5DA|nr:hypothetical protein OG430_39035 [Streptomyces sp. NBC_01304]